jgi:hypothetical protein
MTTLPGDWRTIGAGYWNEIVDGDGFLSSNMIMTLTVEGI